MIYAYTNSIGLNNDVIPIPKPKKGAKHMMYSDFKAWQDESNRIIENLEHATPQQAMEGLLIWQANKLQNDISQLKYELNSAKLNASIINAECNFGRDEKGHMMFTAKQAARATIDSYKLNWFQYVWNLIEYKRAEHYVLKEIEKKANKGLDWIEFSELRWPFDKFPELTERLHFLGFNQILASNFCKVCFSWKEEGITTSRY